MHLTPVKRKILKDMASYRQAKRPKEIAERVGVNFSSCMMHILGLKKLGYVSSPMKGYYRITELGIEAADLIRNSKATSILSVFDPDRTFYFYSGINRYSGIHADSLFEFAENLENISIESLEFHMLRKDFEKWIESIGDIVLARKLAAIREEGLSGETLRERVSEVVRTRYKVLQDSIDGE